MSHPVIKTAEEALNCVLRWEGRLELLDRPRRALLVSRGERKPTPLSPWVAGIVESAERAIRAGEAVVVGDNRIPWEMALWICRAQNGSAICVRESEAGTPSAIFPQHSLCIWPEKQKPALKRTARLLQRDRLIGLLSNCAHCIDIRSGGNMELITKELRARDCPIDVWQRTEIEAHAAAVPQGVSNASRVPSRSTPLDFAGRLTHFTREPDFLWPGETHADFFKWLCSGAQFTPRDSFQSLRRILAEKRIRACGRLIHASVPMVCFTQRQPSELLAENRWRKGLLRWMYSPYALSFDTRDLMPLGAKAVRYATREFIASAPAAERCFMQVAASSSVGWEREAEWRVRGDVDFSPVSPERIVALVARDEEAAQIEREFNIRALAIGPG